MDVPRFLQSRCEDIALFLPHLFQQQQQQQSYGESEQGGSRASAASGMVVNSTTEQLNRRGVFSYRRPSSKNLPFPVAAKLVPKSFDERKAVREKQRASAKQAMNDRGTPADKNKKKTKALRSQSAAAVDAARGGSSTVTTESRLTARQRQRVWKCRLRQQWLRLRRTALRRRMRRLMDRQRGKPLVRTMRFDVGRRNSVGRRRHKKSNSRRSHVATTESLYLPSHRLLRARYRYTTVTRAWTTAQLGALQSLQQQQAEASKRRRRQKAESENVDAASSTTIASSSSSSSLRIAEDVRPTDDPTTLTPPPLRYIKQKTGNEGDGRKGNVLRVRLLVAVRRSMKQFKAILTLGSSWNRHRLRQQDRRRRRQKQSGEQQEDEEEEEEEQMCEPQTLTGLLHDASHLFVWRLRCPSSSSSNLRSLKEVSQLLHQCGGFAFEGDFHHTPQEEGNEVDDDAADRKDVGNDVGNAMRGFVRRGEDDSSTTVIGTPNSPSAPLVSPCVLLRDPPPPPTKLSSDGENPLLQRSGHHEDHDCCYLVTEEIPQAFSARSPYPCDPSGWTLLTKSGGTPLLVSFVSSWSPMVHVDERVSLFRVFLRPTPVGSTTTTTATESVAKVALAAAIQRQLRASILLLHSPDAAGAPPSDNVMPQRQQRNQQPTASTTVVSVYPLSSDAIVPSSTQHSTSTWPFLVLCRTRSSSSSNTSSSVPVQRTTSSQISPQDDENGNTISGEPTTATLLLLHEAESLRRRHFLVARRVFRCLHRFPLPVDAHNNNNNNGLAGWRRRSECRLRPVGSEEMAFFLRQIQWRSYPDSFVVTGYQQSIACSTAMQQVVVRVSAKRHSVLLRPSSRKGMGSDPIALVRIQSAAAPAPAADLHELASDSQQGDNQPMGNTTTRRRRRYVPPLLRIAVVGALTGGIEECLPTGDVRGVFYCWDPRVSALSEEKKVEEPRSTSATVVVEHRSSSRTTEEEDSVSFSSKDRAQTPLYVAVRASTAKLLQTLEQLQRGFPVSERNLGSCPAALRERAARLLESHERHHHHPCMKNSRGSGAQQREEEEVLGRRSGSSGRKRNREGNSATERIQQSPSPVAATLPRVEDILVCDHCCVHAEVVG